MLLELDGVSPQVDESAFVSAQAILIGDVRVGPQSSVWHGAVIRADSGTISIGRGSNVQDNTVIHADDDATIGDGVTIGHGVVCHAKTISDGCLLGNGLRLVLEESLRFADAYGKKRFGPRFQVAGNLSYSSVSSKFGIDGDIDMVLPFAGTGSSSGRHGSAGGVRSGEESAGAACRTGARG